MYSHSLKVQYCLHSFFPMTKHRYIFVSTLATVPGLLKYWLFLNAIPTYVQCLIQEKCNAIYYTSNKFMGLTTSADFSNENPLLLSSFGCHLCIISNFFHAKPLAIYNLKFASLHKSCRNALRNMNL